MPSEESRSNWTKRRVRSPRELSYRHALELGMVEFPMDGSVDVTSPAGREADEAHDTNMRDNEHVPCMKMVRGGFDMQDGRCKMCKVDGICGKRAQVMPQLAAIKATMIPPDATKRPP